VERRRSDVVRRVCARAGRLDGLDRAPTELVTARLLDIGGVGPWAAAVAVATALGDPDVVPLGDPDLPRLVGWALAGEADADDERMLALLAPWSGQRGRVVRLIRAGGRDPTAPVDHHAPGGRSTLTAGGVSPWWRPRWA